MSKLPNKTRDSLGSFALWCRAQECLEAATLLRRHTQPINPQLLLLGLAIELALKAYLRAMGFSIGKLRNKFGHDLKELLAKAENKGLAIARFQNGTLKRADVDVLNAYYLTKEVTYTGKGIYIAKHLPAFFAIAKTLVNVTQKTSIENMERHSDTSKAVPHDPNPTPCK